MQPNSANINYNIPTNDIKKQNNAFVEESKYIKLSQAQQTISYDWAEDVRVSDYTTLRADSDDIVLCALEVTKNTVAVGCKNGTITIHDLVTGNKRATLRGHKASICTLAMVNCLNRQYLASGSDHGCSSICLWDMGTWNMVSRLEGHKAAVTAIVDLDDNQSIISGSYDKRLNIYNLQT